MDLASLALKVDHTQVDAASKSLDVFRDASQKQEGIMRGLQAALGDVGTGFLGVSAVVGTTTAMLLDMIHHADEMRRAAQDMAHAQTASGVAAQGIAQSLRAELEAMQDLSKASITGLHSLDRMEVMKAKLYALGPDYRKMIDDEVMSYADLLNVIEKVNAATLKRIELQIQDQEKQVDKALKPGWMQNLGSALSMGVSTGLGSYLWMRGLDAQTLKLNEENKKLDKLFEDRARIMDKSEYKPKKVTTTTSEDLPGLFTDRRPYKDLIKDLHGLKILRETMVPDFQIATTAAIDFDRVMRQLQERMAQFRQVQSWADPITAGLDALKSDRAILEANRGLLGEESYHKGLEVLQRDLLKLKAANGDTWAIIGQTVVSNSGTATDALMRWSSNLDGLGVSWHTLGDTARNVLADMIRQMERAAIQQKLMQPLMNGLSAALGTMGDGGGWASFVAAFGKAWGGKKAMGGSVYGGTSYLVGEMGPEIFTPGVTGNITPNHALGGTVENRTTISVTVNGATGDTQTSVQAGGAMAEGLKQVVDGYMMAFVARESRQGGALAKG